MKNSDYTRRLRNFTINFGPQHSEAHGVLRLVLGPKGKRNRFHTGLFNFNCSAEKLIEYKTYARHLVFSTDLMFVDPTNLDLIASLLFALKFVLVAFNFYCWYKYYQLNQISLKAQANLVLLAFFTLGCLVFLPDFFLFFCFTSAVCIFSFFFIKDQNPENIIERLYWYLHNMYYHERTLNALGFWSTTFFLRRPEHKNRVFWEVCYLFLLSFFSIMSSRFKLIHRLILLKGFYIILIFGSWGFLFTYLGLIILLTISVYLPPVEKYFKYMYGETIFKEVGWNGKETVLIESLEPLAYGLIVAGVGWYCWLRS